MDALKCNENCFECEHLQNGNVEEFCSSKMSMLLTAKIARMIIGLEQKINLLIEMQGKNENKKSQKVESELLKSKK